MSNKLTPNELSLWMDVYIKVMKQCLVDVQKRDETSKLAATLADDAVKNFRDEWINRFDATK